MTTFNRLSAIAVFLGAFLLFQVQPIISKAILPWYGGSPSVWTTCMLFFQVALVAGYAYSYVVDKYLSAGRQVLLNVLLLGVACLFLPILPGERWKPEAGGDAATQILVLLIVVIGMPYLLLATTGPLVQSWYGKVNPNRSPYRLYALSNLGSFTALLTFPFIVEPAMTTSQQAWMWSICFVIFAIAYGWLAWIQGQVSSKQTGAKSSSKSKRAGNASSEAVATWKQRVTWLCLPAFAVVALLAVTNYLCQDIAVVPFLWIGPLSLYLLSFVVCFEREHWYSRKWFGLAGTIAILFVANAQLSRTLVSPTGDSGIQFPFLFLFDSTMVQAGTLLAASFFLFMVCHGELAVRKPARQHLTLYYLHISVGGALGGVFVAIICPLIFNEYLEMSLTLIFGLVFSFLVMYAGARTTWFQRYRLLQPLSILVAVVGFVVVASAQYNSLSTDAIAKERNFYGTLFVKPHSPGGLALYHGRIVHGYQHLQKELQNEPTTYYSRDSGVGLVLEHFPRATDQNLNVLAVGLGTGTVAAYGEKGDHYRFFEINPAVVAMADEFFLFLRNSLASTDVVLGDARLSLAEEPDQSADILVLDAFSGDAIPVHLLTVEAFELYQRILKPEGILCVHVSNRHLRLAPVVVRIAEEYGLSCYEVTTENDKAKVTTASTWVLVTKNTDAMHKISLHGTVQAVSRPDRSVPLWTDQHCSLWQILE